MKELRARRGRDPGPMRKDEEKEKIHWKRRAGQNWGMPTVWTQEMKEAKGLQGLQARLSALPSSCPGGAKIKDFVQHALKISNKVVFLFDTHDENLHTPPVASWTAGGWSNI